MADKIHTMKEEMSSKDTQSISLAIEGRKYQIKENGDITITTRIGETRTIESLFLAHLLDTSTEEVITVEIRQGPKAKWAIAKIKARKTVSRKRKKQYPKIVLKGKHIREEFDRTIQIRIPSGQLTKTAFFQKILLVPARGFSLAKIKYLLRFRLNYFPTEKKERILELFIRYLQEEQPRKELLTFRDYSGHILTLFEDSTAPLKFSCSNTKTRQLKLPTITGLFFSPKVVHCFLVNEQLVPCTVTKTKNSFQISLPKNISLESREIKILLDFEDKANKPFVDVYSGIKEGRDFRTGLGLNFYERMLKNKVPQRIHHRVLAIYKRLYSKGYVIPIIRQFARNSKHNNQAFDYFISRTFRQLIDSSQKEILLLQEPVISAPDGSVAKAADWFLLAEANGETESYIIEVRTCQGKEKTRTLNEAIAEYALLVRSIPELGMPVIIVDWKLNRNNWISYAARFGVLLVDVTDVYEFLTENNLLVRLREEAIAARSEERVKAARINSAKETLARWIKEENITKKDIHEIAHALQLQNQHLLNLFKSFEVTIREPFSALHRYGELQVKNTSSLMKICEQLLAGTKIIVEEELKFTKNRIAQLHSKEIAETGHERPFQRRRQTFDSDRLLLLQDELEKLLSVSDYWGEEFRPVSIRMLQHKSNLGFDYESSVYKQLVERGFLVIRNITVMIESHTRELDIIGFRATQDNQMERILVSCSDSSSYKSKFHYAKKTILGKYRELFLLREILKFEKAILFVQVSNTEEAMQVNEWTEEEFQNNEKNDIEIQIKE